MIEMIIGQTVWQIVEITWIYGDDEVMIEAINGDWVLWQQKILQIDSDHVQMDIMYLVHESLIIWLYTGIMQKIEQIFLRQVYNLKRRQV